MLILPTLIYRQRYRGRLMPAEWVVVYPGVWKKIQRFKGSRFRGSGLKGQITAEIGQMQCRRRSSRGHNLEPLNPEPRTLGPEKGLITCIRRLFDAEVLDFVKKGFVTDIEDFCSFASVPARFFENVRYDLFFNPIQRLFPDFLQG